MADSHAIYFPLRGNASALLAGAPFDRFRKRLKVAAILYDRLILDEGAWLGFAGPTVNYQMRIPLLQAPPQLLSPQTAFDRRQLTGGNVQLRTSKDESSEPDIPIAATAAKVFWRATFEPIRQELPHAYPWIEFDNFSLNAQAEKTANQLAMRFADDPLLKARYDEPFTQGLIAKNASHSLILGGLMRATIGVDALHGEVLAAQLAEGVAIAPGKRALAAVIPDVRDLTWDEVNTARTLPGLPRLREILLEVEDEAAKGGPFDEEVMRAFHARYRQATEDLAPTWSGVGRSILIGGLVSLVTMPLAGPVGLVGGFVLGSSIEVGRHLRGISKRQNSWLSAADRLASVAEPHDDEGRGGA